MIGEITFLQILPSTKLILEEEEVCFILDMVRDRKLCSAREGPLLPTLYPACSFFLGLGQKTLRQACTMGLHLPQTIFLLSVTAGCGVL